MLGLIPFLSPSKIKLRASYTPPLLRPVLELKVSCVRLRSGSWSSWGPRLGVFVHYSMPLKRDSDEVGPKLNMKSFHANKHY